MFIMTLTNIAWNWFEPIMNGIQDMASLNEPFPKIFNSWGQTQRQQGTYLYNMKFDHAKHHVKHYKKLEEK